MPNSYIYVDRKYTKRFHEDDLLTDNKSMFRVISVRLEGNDIIYGFDGIVNDINELRFPTYKEYQVLMRNVNIDKITKS